MEEFDTLLDERDPAARVEISIARAEYDLKASIRATARFYSAVHDTLSEARAFPETFVGAVFAAAPDAVDFAVRAAALDIAVRVSVAEQTVRGYDHLVETLRGRAPSVWALFYQGDISIPNVRVVGDIVSALPEDLWSDFQAAALSFASLPPSKFKNRMRIEREKLQPDAVERHRVAMLERRVWLERDIDGMSDFGVHGPAAASELAMANVDRIAREMASEPDETRTLAQIRADVALDLLGGTSGSSTGAALSVGLLVPVMTMLGHSDEPAMLEGYGPIDAETARSLAANSPVFYRILTDPVTGTMIDVEQPRYRPNSLLDRKVRLRDQECTMPGCSRPAVRCDLDHTVPWPNGPTRYDNLKALCRNHHRVKHNSLWNSQQDVAGNTTWTSPTGFVRPADPPPF